MLERVPLFVGNQWAAFRHPIANRITEVDGFEKRLYLFIDGCTTNHDFAEVPTERDFQLLGDLLAYLLVDVWHFQQQFDQWLFQFGKDLVLDDLLDNEWHGKDQRRANRRKCLCDDFWTRRACQEMNVAAFVDGVQHFER